jgi:hypothetical protein
MNLAQQKGKYKTRSLLYHSSSSNMASNTGINTSVINGNSLIMKGIVTPF